ncbi:pirin family protein [Rhodovibrio salinarum]|uniref:Pirin family protein n=1 Tax=Rhodovibrio salinarum TaxID=1087 RepID=A0A934QGC0_9PROT|nr:pirin family protein [Rhodovibrio salinarum]MBK1696264.1 pirin family protein [Rhodovibrio salinarum]
MIEHRPFQSLGAFELDWLSARYHFSFGQYHDPARMGVGPLRVWNDDTVQPGTGFDPHGHRNMEIITYVRRGAITHEDNLGNQGRTPAGDVQVMTAGKGVIHAEYNREPEITQLFQIWIQPAQERLTPRWDQRAFPSQERAGRLVPLASGRPGHDEVLPIHQDAALFGATLRAGQTVRHALGRERQGYLVASTGQLTVNGTTLDARDGAVISEEDEIEITAVAESELLLADLP